MLLQGSRATERPSRATPAAGEQINVRPEPCREAAPQLANPSARRTYPPITWSHPSLGRVLAHGLGGVSRTMALLVLLGVALIGTAMGIAMVVTSILQALGFDASASY